MGPLPPSEVHVFVDDDGQVTFSDLPADLAEVALLLDPDSAPACPVPARPPTPRGRKKEKR